MAIFTTSTPGRRSSASSRRNEVRPVGHHAGGLLAASEHGADVIKVVRGLDVYSVDQFYQSLYRPDLVREKLAGDPRGPRARGGVALDLTKTVASGEAPAVRIVSPQDGANTPAGAVTVEAEISDRGGGSGRVEWRQRHHRRRRHAGIRRWRPAGAAGARPDVDLGGNSIEIVAYNAANLVASVPARPRCHRAGGRANRFAAGLRTGRTRAPAAARPRMFALVAGVNDYADKRIRLSYAASDARRLRAAFKEAGCSFIRRSRLCSRPMPRSPATNSMRPSPTSPARPAPSDVLRAASRRPRQDGRWPRPTSFPRDFVVDGELNEKSIGEAVKVKAIAQEQWQRWFASIPARKSVILFDTCDSGTLTGDASETQQLERGAANDRLAQATGRRS